MYGNLLEWYQHSCLKSVLVLDWGRQELVTPEFEGLQTQEPGENVPYIVAARFKIY
jgi:hypothetical protein